MHFHSKARDSKSTVKPEHPKHNYFLHLLFLPRSIDIPSYKLEPVLTLPFQLSCLWHLFFTPTSFPPSSSISPPPLPIFPVTYIPSKKFQLLSSTELVVAI
ncbi:hypothetical protein CDAR_468711 [Caerostris darwini]|uniref:Uncharacterized protein n=1 Tax=Caerostris darwini TaxID=1538125 RepID=A0AAV4T786_9ARAC|nr:hypothetical protein CDAR_468711 [Caerostris darwini]